MKKISGKEKKKKDAKCSRAEDSPHEIYIKKIRVIILKVSKTVFLLSRVKFFFFKSQFVKYNCCATIDKSTTNGKKKNKGIQNLELETASVGCWFSFPCELITVNN